MSRFDGRRFPFAGCGQDVTVYEWVRVLHPAHITIGEHVVIDDFVMVDGGIRLSIGSWVHLASHSSIVGGGEAHLGDFVGLSPGARVITGTELVDGSGLTNPTVPEHMRAVRRGVVRLEEHSFLGTNTVVHPDVTIGQGAVVGSGSVVTSDLPAWTICIGSPARPVRHRPSAVILERASRARSGS